MRYLKPFLLVLSVIFFVGASTGVAGAQSSNPSVLAPVVKTTPLYSFPSLSANQVGTLLQGQTWFLIGKDVSGKWVEVQITSNTLGWAPINTFNLGKATLPVVAPANAMVLSTVLKNVAVYANATTKSNTLGSLVVGQNWFVLAYDKTKRWVEIQIVPGEDGWVFANTFNLTGALIPVLPDVNGSQTSGTYHYIAYYVQAGDTLGSIAAYYGTTYQVLAQVNGIANPDLIYVGQLIYIPIYNG